MAAPVDLGALDHKEEPPAVLLEHVQGGRRHFGQGGLSLGVDKLRVDPEHLRGLAARGEQAEDPVIAGIHRGIHAALVGDVGIPSGHGRVHDLLGRLTRVLRAVVAGVVLVSADAAAQQDVDPGLLDELPPRLDGVAHQEHLDLDLPTLGDRSGQPEGVVGAFGAVGRIVDDEQGGLAHGSGSLVSRGCHRAEVPIRTYTPNQVSHQHGVIVVWLGVILVGVSVMGEVPRGGEACGGISIETPKMRVVM